ncbi:MAG: RsbRD N-terminal domain-containing protein [Coriobacteriia bacterium]|nr:RsbRD N-terminal domain-containing protein [Coriobacteriia bacterium]
MQTALFEKITSQRERILALWKAAALPQDRGLPAKATAKSGLSVPIDELQRERIDALLDWLVSAEEPAAAREHLREICKVKAVLAQTPSEALGFILELKRIIRLVVDGPAADGKDLNELDKRIDQLMLLAFDEYSDCRERLMEVKVNEMRRLAGRYAS